MSNKNIVAIGGGGFGRSLSELKIEKYITSLVKKERPKICFIPTASGDNVSYKLNFYRAFSKLNCITSHLDFFSRTENLEKKILSQDIILVEEIQKVCWRFGKNVICRIFCKLLMKKG